MNRIRPDPASHWDLDRLRQFWPALAIAAACLAIALGGEEAREWARYEREALEAGQWWRLATAHLAHLGWGHLWLNLAGLALIAALLHDVLASGDWVVAGIAGAAGIGAGLYWLEPRLEWYVGLSGVLHAVLAAGALKLCVARSALGAVLAAVLAGKLAWEQWAGAMPFSTPAAGPVIVEAHLYGAGAGLLAALAMTAVRCLAARPL